METPSAPICQLHLPPAPVEMRAGQKSMEIFDPQRHKWVALTPEEWVRQHFTHFLSLDKGVPSSMMANEMGITLNSTSRRCDTVIYAPDLRPVAIVEYKAPSVRITEQTFHQIARYNIALHVPWLIVSNGLSHYCLSVDYNALGCNFVTDIPTYEEMIRKK